MYKEVRDSTTWHKLFVVYTLGNIKNVWFFIGLKARLLCRLLITRCNVVFVLILNKINCLPYTFFVLYHQEAKNVIVEREPMHNMWI